MMRIARFAFAGLLAISAPLAVSAQTGGDLFQQALRKERVDGDLKGAIALYQRLLKEHSSDRSLVARTLVQLGQVYEKQGNANALAAYQRVVRDYAEQGEQASIARARLEALSANAGVAAATAPAVRRIWSGPEVDELGSPTRDGRLLTFVDWTTGDLAVRDLATGAKRHLTNKGSWTTSIAFALYSKPSPDGRRVVYAWYNEHAQPQLKVIGIDGSDSRVLLVNPELEYFQPADWSPDGKQILATLYPLGGQVSQIALVSSTDGTVHVLKSLDWRGPSAMSFSPDGRYIVYDAAPTDASQQRDVFVIASDGSSETTLISHPAQDIALGWAPDGKHVLFGSDRTGNLSMWLAPVQEGKPAGEPVLVRHDAESALLPMGFTQNGTFFYGRDPAPVDVYMAALDPRTGKLSGNASRIVEHYVGANSSADWSHDGKAIVYLSQRRPGVQGRSGRMLIVRSVDSGVERVVPSTLQYRGVPRWAPKDQYIVVSGRDMKGRQGIFRIDPQSGEASALVQGPNLRLAGWSADGESIIYFLQDVPRVTWAIVRHDMRTGEERDVYRVSGRTNIVNIFQVQVSPDGQQVAFVANGDSATQTIRVVSADGGQPTDVYRLPKNFGTGESLGWSADSRYLFFARNKDLDDREGAQPPVTVPPARAALFRVAVTGGAPEETGLRMDQIKFVRAHPDGQHIAFTSGTGSAEVWVMEHFLPKPGTATKPPQR